MSRTLYLAAYDIPCTKRLYKIHKILKDYATGGQYSFFECPLHPSERRQLITQVSTILTKQDSFFLIKIDKRTSHHQLGIAREPQDLDYFYFG